MNERTVENEISDNGVRFVITELDTGLTFMDIADTSEVAENIQRNRENAHQAYDGAQRLLTKLRPTSEQERLIQARSASLKARLHAAGYF